MAIKINQGIIYISLTSPVQLSRFNCLLNKNCDDIIKSQNIVYGVYFIVDNKNRKIFSDKGKFIPKDSIKYIGKARRETIFSRNRKHAIAISPPPHPSHIRPGCRFRKFAASIGHDASKLWVIPAIMSNQAPYLISCAEEYFLCEYEKRHNELPQANSEGSCIEVDRCSRSAEYAP